MIETRWRRLAPLAAGTLAALAAACGGGSTGGPTPARPATSAPSPRPAPPAPRRFAALVDVSVATLWTAPSALRPVDRPAAASPVALGRWLGRMTIADRRGLVGRVQTQALYGTRVVVLGRSGAWTRVAVAGQPTPLDPRGYPGWLPTRQLAGSTAFTGLRATHPVAIVARRLAWLRDPGSLRPRLRVSYATRLVVVGRAGRFDLVATPRGGRLAIAASAVAEYRSIAAVPPPSGAQIVAEARHFLGLPYLWGGTSGFGVDCSGLSSLVFRRFGITIPRDADRQAVRGRPIERARLRPGDLVFFAGPGGTGAVHHVGIAIGGGAMIDAPGTGQAVRVVPIAALGAEYAGARRYLP